MPQSPPPDEEEDEAESRIVLVFTAKAPLATGPFRRWKMTPLAETGDKGMVVLTAAESRRTFARLVEQYGGNEDEWDNPDAWRTQLDAIEGVRLYDREDRLDPQLEAKLPAQDRLVVDVSLWPSTLLGRSARRSVGERLADVEQVVSAAKARDQANRIMVTDPRPETPMVRVTADAELLEELLQQPWVECVAPPRTAEVSLADLAAVSPPSQRPEPQGEPIGIVDDQVMDNPYLEGVIAAQASFPADFAWQPPTQHGTQVAGLAAYGGLRPLTTGSGTLSAPHPVHAARILHADPDNTGRARVAGLFHLELESAIRWLAAQGVKIINVSVTDEAPSTRAHASETTVVIDSLARELGLVIVVAAGNRTTLQTGHWRDDYPTYLQHPEAGIAEPGTAALAVTTGAISWRATPGGTHAHSLVAIAGQKQAAPFTRVGPTRGTTPAGTLKPEFVAHGGNWAWDEQIGGVVTSDPDLGVIVLANPARASGRLLGITHGTSFAAPYVAHEAAEIATRYPDAGPNLLRCLLALSAEDHNLDPHVAAYGMPSANKIMESGSHHVVLTFEGRIPPNHTVVHPIPVPREFARGRTKQRITIALAFDPPVRRTRRTYQAATMSVDLVRNLTQEDVIATFQKQPSREEVKENTALLRRDLPPRSQRPALEPNSTAIQSNTLIRRHTRTTNWDPDDEGYYLVVRHDLQSWAGTLADVEDQDYAVAVELTLDETADIDLYARVRAELQTRPRLRVTT